jgi:hypothetical protein
MAGSGYDTHFDSDGDNSAQAARTTGTRLFGIEVSNTNTADAYLQLFNTSTSGVTVGSTTPKLSLLVPAGSGSNDGAMDKDFTDGIEFDTALTYACTTSATGSGDPSTGLILNLWFRG